MAANLIEPLYKTDIREFAELVNVPVRSINSDSTPTICEYIRKYLNDFDFGNGSHKAYLIHEATSGGSKQFKLILVKSLQLFNLSSINPNMSYGKQTSKFKFN
jgi:hypothetical protein